MTDNTLTTAFTSYAAPGGWRMRPQAAAGQADQVEWGTLPTVKVPRSGAELVANLQGGAQAAPETPAPPTAVSLAEEAEHPEHGGLAKKLGMGMMLALGVAAPMLMPVVAHAAPAQQAVQTRSTTPVRVATVQEVVDKFDADKQFYVVGDPALNGTRLTQQDYARIQETLKQHPNAYVVLVAQTDNLNRDDNLLSRGVANSPEFQSVVNPQTGEREGVVFMIYTNVTDQSFIDATGKTRALFMRSEELPDRLGVGENAFASETGEPRELMRLYIDAFANGKGMHGALDAVMDRVNGTIAAHVEQVVGTARQSMTSAEQALARVEPKVKDFQKKFGTGGTLGSPDVQGWKNQLAQARQALQKRDFAAAQRISQSLVSTLSTYEQAAANYESASGVAQQLQAQLDELGPQIQRLEDNDAGKGAKAHYQAARESMEQFRVAFEAKDPAYSGHLETAQQEASQAASQASQSRSDTELKNKVILYGTSAVVAAILATAFIMNRLAARKGKAAREEYQAAMSEIAQKSRELMDLMNEADYTSVANYTGKTKKLADELVQNTADALALVGGANKFLAEADALINAKGVGGKLSNMFLGGNYRKAVALLTDENSKLPFDFHDSSRAVMEKGSHAETWREELLKAGTSRVWEKSLKEVLAEMAERRDTARGLLTEIEKKDAEITNYLSSVEAQAGGVRTASLKLQESGKADGFFVAAPVTENLLPLVLAEGDQGGLVARGRAIKDNDPVRAWDEFADPAKRLSGDAEAIVKLGNEARESLLPTLGAADQKLHPHQVKTDWAHKKKEELSARLDTTANTAMRSPVGDQIKALERDIDALEARVNTVVDQDRQRREVCPKQMADAEKDVETARQEIHGKLQQMGTFKKGTPDQVLREPRLDPTARTQEAHKNHDAIKARLDVGDIEQAGQHLENVRNLTQDAHRLVRETRQALDAYPSTLKERKDRRRSIADSIAGTFQPSLDRIKKTYAPEVLRLVAPEVNAGETLADNVSKAQEHLTGADRITAAAEASFDKAHL
ncbi:MAG: hypothetical protein AB1758_18410, partial [Candidatus Eremiobacterota bacterium]